MPISWKWDLLQVAGGAIIQTYFQPTAPGAKIDSLNFMFSVKWAAALNLIYYTLKLAANLLHQSPTFKQEQLTQCFAHTTIHRNQASSDATTIFNDSSTYAGYPMGLAMSSTADGTLLEDSMKVELIVVKQGNKKSLKSTKWKYETSRKLCGKVV